MFQQHLSLAASGRPSSAQELYRSPVARVRDKLRMLQSTSHTTRRSPDFAGRQGPWLLCLFPRLPYVVAVVVVTTIIDVLAEHAAFSARFKDHRC